MKHTTLILTALFSAFSATYYVDPSRPDDTGDAITWATAKQTIQTAVDLTIIDDSVLVTNGTYNTGGAVAPAYVRASGTHPNTLTVLGQLPFAVPT